MDNRLVKIQVVFNPDDPDQLNQYNFAAKRKNMSGYLKRLIQRDIDQSLFQFVNDNNESIRHDVPSIESETVRQISQLKQHEEQQEELFSFDGFI